MSPAEAAEYGLIDRVLEGPMASGGKPADSDHAAADGSDS